MENRFTKILLTCGAIPLMEILEYAKEHELYEDCAQIRDALKMGNIPDDFSIEDFKQALYRLGFPGEAINNLPVYTQKAMQMAGYN